MGSFTEASSCMDTAVNRIIFGSGYRLPQASYQIITWASFQFNWTRANETLIEITRTPKEIAFQNVCTLAAILHRGRIQNKNIDSKGSTIVETRWLWGRLISTMRGVPILEIEHILLNQIPHLNGLNATVMDSTFPIVFTVIANGESISCHDRHDIYATDAHRPTEIISTEIFLPYSSTYTK